MLQPSQGKKSFFQPVWICTGYSQASSVRSNEPSFRPHFKQFFVAARQFGDNLNKPPPPGAQPDDVLLAAAGIHGLSVEHFPAQDDVDLQAGRFPGLNSAQLTIDQINKNINQKLSVQDTPLSGSACAPVNHTNVNGQCANVFDVVISRKCVQTRTEKSTACQSNEVCCFKLSNKDVVESSFDQIPCGLRRTPELAQRELQRVADEENFAEVPMRILGGLEAFQNEICWQVRWANIRFLRYSNAIAKKQRQQGTFLSWVPYFSNVESSVKWA